MKVCASFSADAWPQFSNTLVDDDLLKLMVAYVELSLFWSTWCEVACISNEVVGFIFGRIEKDASPIKNFKTYSKTLYTLLKLILGRYGRLKQPVTFIKKFWATESIVEEKMPKADGSIELFAVSSRHQGKGIGRKLMNRFLQFARMKKARLITVYTDPISNFKFYEIIGFKRHVTFDDPFNTYMEGKKIPGFIYTYQIQ